MYLPSHFKSQELSDAVELMKTHSFATLISSDNDGYPYLTHLPLHLETGLQDGGKTPLVLLGHVAKGNPHWRYLRDRSAAVVSFMGPHAYMSPRVYPDLLRVPTWNYLAVECRVHATLIEADDAKDSLLQKMIDDYDPNYLKQWKSLATEYVNKMLAQIVAFKLEVTGYQCKLKLNQHRPEAHAEMRKAYSAGNDDERELASWMDKLRLTGTEDGT